VWGGYLIFVILVGSGYLKNNNQNQRTTGSGYFENFQNQRTVGFGYLKRYQTQRTASSGYFKNFKKLLGFMKELANGYEIT